MKVDRLTEVKSRVRVSRKLLGLDLPRLEVCLEEDRQTLGFEVPFSQDKVIRIGRRQHDLFVEDVDARAIVGIVTHLPNEIDLGDKRLDA